MSSRPAFSLLETLLAAAILAMVVAACLPLLTRSPASASVRPDPGLARYAHTPAASLPPNLTTEQSASTVAGEIEGTWITVRAGDRITLAWIPTDPITREGAP
jgi:hypothetical protein